MRPKSQKTVQNYLRLTTSFLEEVPVGHQRFLLYDSEEGLHAHVLADQTTGQVLEPLLIVDGDVVAEELVRHGRFRKHDEWK